LQRQEAGLTPEQQAMLEDNCGPFGAPHKTRPEGVLWEHGPTHVVFREGYVLEHSDMDKIALWVCERVRLEETEGDVSRSDNFRPDPELPENARAEKSDYEGSGYDRGHMAPAANQKSSERLMDETFFLSNIAPQIGAGFNQHAWRDLEALTRGWAVERGEAIIVTGGIFFDPKEKDGNTADGMIEYFTIGAGQVSVPTHFYKIVLAQNEEGQWEAIAFVMENRKHTSPHDFAESIVAIDWIEESAALNFFPDMDPSDQRELEKDPASMWH
jgi:endonuclease G